MYTFQHRSHLVGYYKVILYMSCNDHDDMDVFVQLRKADSAGKTLQNINIPLSDLQMQSSEVETVNCLKYLGPTGIFVPVTANWTLASRSHTGRSTRMTGKNAWSRVRLCVWKLDSGLPELYSTRVKSWF